MIFDQSFASDLKNTILRLKIFSYEIAKFSTFIAVKSLSGSKISWNTYFESHSSAYAYVRYVAGYTIPIGEKEVTKSD